MKFAIVITTIYLPKVLETLARNFDTFGRKDEVEVLIIGDLKSPPETHAYVAQFAAQGFHFEYWDVDKQKSWLKPFPDLADIIPYNTDNRRNIGHLIAYERKRECIIALDDDNYPLDGIDYLEGYECIGKQEPLVTVSSKTHWYNICDHLEYEPSVRVYPRGYPYKHRWSKDEVLTYQHLQGRVVVKGGLWLGDPDIDAVTRLAYPIKAVSLKKEETIALAHDTHCPFNTQNTAVHRDIIPAYYYVVMGEQFKGLKIDRYGDIWSSYLAKKVIDQMNDYVTFGKPLVYQDRHAHDLFQDLREEYWGMVWSNQLAEILEGISLQSTSGYAQVTRELSQQLENCIAQHDAYDTEIKNYFYKICQNMRIWVDVCEALALSPIA